MFGRALLRQARQFSSAPLSGLPRTRTPLAVPARRPWPLTPRLRAYSSEPETRSEEKPETEPEERPERTEQEQPAGNCEKEKAELAEATKQLDTAKKEALDYKDKWTRTVAEYRNLIERTERDKRAAKDFAIQKLAKDLVDNLDNFDRALEAVPEEARDAEKNKDLVDLYNGLDMTRTILMNTLKKHGVERVDPTGEAFDPNRHEATFQVPMPDKEPNTVFHVQQIGYILNGRTLRAAKVGVVKAPN